MKWYLFLIVITAFIACDSSKEVKQIYTERFTIGRIDSLQKVDENTSDTLQNIQTILLGLELGADSVTSYNQLQKKLQKEADGSFLFAFPNPKLAMIVKPYFYQNKLWKVELYEKSPQKRDDYDTDELKVLTTILSKYYPEENIDEMPLSSVMDIPGETTSFKVKDNLMVAVRFHPSQGITVGYIDLYAIRQMEILKNKQIKDMAKDL